MEFAWVGVGPMAGRVLGGWGATVVKIETSATPCPLRTMGPFKDLVPGPDRSAFYTLPNPNKFGLSLNLNKPEAQEVARKLIGWADVVTESYTPGAMKNWGLDYEEARKIKPDIIYYSTCMQGQTGPHRLFRGYGVHMAALAGYYHLTGWPDKDPAGPYGAYTDFIAMLYGEAIVLAALDYRRRTGKGLYIDLSQIEAGLQFLGPVLLDYTTNGRVRSRRGNRDERACPHGAYPCSGEDRWVTITVFNDNAWQRLCHAMGNPEWTRDPRFATFLSRKENEDELDSLIAEWTKNFTPEELVRPAPCLGEHNEYVLKELLKNVR
ncbi:MAG: CoA transferase [Chloroflexi bacterium]|nr:MAG: CoA transferase [Chloroflexota bacterium]